jgi:hypothetical protein
MVAKNTHTILKQKYIKGTVSRDFRPLVFFHQTIPSGPLIHGLKHFRIWLRIHKVIWSHIRKCSPSGVIDLAQATWAVSMTPLRLPQQILLCKLGSKSRSLSGVNDTAQTGDLEFGRLCPPLKGISIKKLHSQIVLLDNYNNRTKNIGVIKWSFLPWAESLTQLRPKLAKSNIFANSKPYAKRL